MDLTSALSLERSKKSKRYFYEWLGYTWGDHIQEWMDLYGDRGDSEVHRVCIIAPRDHSKSTTLRVAALWSSLFEQWREKPFTTWLFSASKDLASRRLEEIRDDMMRHPKLSKLIDKSRGTKLELRFTNGAWIRATSVGAAIRGEHPARIIMDDVLDDLGDMSMDNLRHWFRKKITPMLSPATSIFVVGTPMSMNDLYHTEMLTKDTWKSGVWSAIPNWDEHRHEPKKLKCLWPEQRSLRFLLEQKDSIGDLAFTQEYLCKVVDDDSQVYKREHSRANLHMDRMLDKNANEKGRYVVGFDPSHGLGQDYSVMVILRQDIDTGDVYFVDMWRRNDFPPAEQAEQIRRFNDQYSKPLFAFEDVGFQRMYEALLQQKGIIVNSVMSKVSNRVMKQGLLNRMRVWFEQKKIHFPFGDDETRRTVNIFLDELDAHVWRSGNIEDVGKHNDCVMAFAHALDQLSSSGGVPMPVAVSRVSGSQWTTKKGQGKGGRNTGKRPKSGKFVGFF